MPGEITNMHMKDDLKIRTEVPGALSSRRQFMRVAAAAGGAGVLSAGMGSGALGSAAETAQMALPTATKEVTPFKVHVPQAALDDLKKRLASTRWPERETVGDWSQGVPL